jgi:hypothetical protein
MGGARSTYRNRRSAYRVLVGKPEEKRQLGRLRRRWENNSKMDFSRSGLRPSAGSI